MLGLLLACAEPTPAPRDLDTLLHDAWAHYHAEDDDALAAAVRELVGVVDEAALPLEGTVTDLTREEVDAAGFPDGPDPAPARGLYTIGFVDCTPDEMERILVSRDQMALYPENYLEYARTYTTDTAAYVARDTHSLRWDTDYTVQIGLWQYRSEVLGGAHWTPDGDDGPYLFSSTVMIEPAEAVEGDVTFDVDYQIEVFYPHEGGMVHAFGMWRQFAVGDLSTEDEGVADLILGGLRGWDEDTTAICAEGRVPAELTGR